MRSVSLAVVFAVSFFSPHSNAADLTLTEVAGGVDQAGAIIAKANSELPAYNQFSLENCSYADTRVIGSETEYIFENGPADDGMNEVCRAYLGVFKDTAKDVVTHLQTQETCTPNQ